MGGIIGLLLIVAVIIFYIRRKQSGTDKPLFKASAGTGNPKKHETISRERELDNLLDKVRKKGMKSLSDVEKARLKELSELIGS